MTSFTKLQNSDCGPSLAERVAKAVVALVFAAIAVLSTASVVLALLAA